MPEPLDPAAYLAALPDPSRRDDTAALIALFTAATGQKPAAWGSMVGFGHYHYRYASGREGDSFPVGFALRAKEIVIYLNGLTFDDEAPHRTALLARLGRHREGKGCLYLRSLADIDTAVLAEMAKRSVARLRREYGEG